MNEFRNCHYCGEAISGRSDKKFCDDHCRSNYNSRMNYSSVEIRAVNSILRRNRRILDAFASAGKVKIEKTNLHEKGFNFRFHTHTQSSRGHIYKMCYDYAWITADDGQVTIEKVGLPDGL